MNRFKQWLAGIQPHKADEKQQDTAYQQAKALFAVDAKNHETQKNAIISVCRLPERFSDDGAR